MATRNPTPSERAATRAVNLEPGQARYLRGGWRAKRGPGWYVIDDFGRVGRWLGRSVSSVVEGTQGGEV